MTHKSRKRLALLILTVGLPFYIIFAASVMSWMLNQDIRFPVAVEVLIYIALGIGWVFPIKWVFLGIGQVDPDADKTE